MLCDGTLQCNNREQVVLFHLSLLCQQYRWVQAKSWKHSERLCRRCGLPPTSVVLNTLPAEYQDKEMSTMSLPVRAVCNKVILTWALSTHLTFTYNKHGNFYYCTCTVSFHSANLFFSLTKIIFDFYYWFPNFDTFINFLERNLEQVT